MPAQRAQDLPGDRLSVLKELLEAGVVRETAFGEKHHHFEHLYDEKHHHHARCIRCCALIEFPDLHEEKLYKSVLKGSVSRSSGTKCIFTGYARHVARPEMPYKYLGKDRCMTAGWRREPKFPSLPEVFSPSIPVPVNAGFLAQIAGLCRPGLMVAVGYMDPGNWATDLVGGARFGYTLLSVILVSKFNGDLAPAFVPEAWASSAAATWPRLAGTIIPGRSRSFCGSSARSPSPPAISPRSSVRRSRSILLFGIPLVAGILLTAFDVMIILFCSIKGFGFWNVSWPV